MSRLSAILSLTLCAGAAALFAFPGYGDALYVVGPEIRESQPRIGFRWSQRVLAVGVGYRSPIDRSNYADQFGIHHGDGIYGWRTQPIEHGPFSIHWVVPFEGKMLAITAPAWFVAVFGATIVLISGRSICKNWPGDHRGYCTNCGYDLRATPDRCPDCGMRCADRGASSAAK